MSLYAPDDFGYLQQAEAYFLSHSKIGVMLSSKDTELLRHWRDAGVPIEVVCNGIRRGFHEFKEAPRAVFRCRHFVEDELHAWKERMAGEAQGALPLRFELPGRELPDPTDPQRRKRRDVLRGEAPAQPPASAAPSAAELAQKTIPPDERTLACWYRCMWRLVELGQQIARPAAREAYRLAYRRMNELRQEALLVKGDPDLPRSLGLAVGQVEAEMYDQVYANLDPSTRADVDARLPSNMEQALGKMSAEARERQQRIWRRRLLEEVLGLQPFFVP